VFPIGEFTSQPLRKIHPANSSRDWEPHPRSIPTGSTIGHYVRASTSFGQNIRIWSLARRPNTSGPAGHPDAAAAVVYVRRIDRRIGELLELAHDFRIMVTAVQGMRARPLTVDLVAAPAAAGIRATFAPPIKDRSVVHHQNRGGSGYVFFHPVSVEHARTISARLPGVLAVEEWETAAQLFRLPLDACGDLFVLADEETVFAPSGVFSDIVTPVSLRSHGSQHERTVPMWGVGVDVRSARWNLDASRLLGLVPKERT